MEETRWKEKNQYLGLTEDGRRVRLLDQSQLPNREVWLELEEQEELAEAIRTLRVRGAPAIGVFAAYALYVLARRLADRAPVEAAFRTRLREWAAGLAATRPTAVNLRWALERMLARADRTAGPPEQIVQVLERECRAIHREDGEMCRRIAEHGLTLVGEGDGILTHCNAGALAASRYGTALGPILLGQERGKKLRVFADETRPLLQGARLTAWELARAGVEVTLICDNMASMVMKNGWVQACFVGCDRVAANGDTANKIGTSGLAVLARYYNVPFYVLGPTSTIDLDCPTGADIPIEERDGEEIRSLWYQEPMAPAGVRCWDPAFDVTDHSLISAIVTEGGICRPPFGESLRELVSRERGMRRELEPREAGAAAEDLPGRPPDSPGGLCGGQRRESVCPVLRWRGAHYSLGGL